MGKRGNVQTSKVLKVSLYLTVREGGVQGEVIGRMTCRKEVKSKLNIKHNPSVVRMWIVLSQNEQ